LDSTWVVLGRVLNLSPTIRPMIGFLYLVGLYLFTGFIHRFMVSHSE
jgi:hypothetical protein